MMEMQEENEQAGDGDSQQLFDAQKEALAMQQAVMIEREKQQKMLQDQQLVRSHVELIICMHKQIDLHMILLRSKHDIAKHFRHSDAGSDAGAGREAGGAAGARSDRGAAAAAA